MKNRTFALAVTLGVGIALFAATGTTSARADGNDWRYHDHYDNIRFEREHDREAREHRRFEEARERRIEQERRERLERERREHARFERDFGHETHGDHDWRDWH